MDGTTRSARRADMDIDPKLIPIAISLVALCVPWLYNGTLFTRQRVWTEV